MNIQNAFDGKTARVGDKVWSIQLGDAKVAAIDETKEAEFPVVLETKDGGREYYTIDGKDDPDDLIPSVYYGPPDIIGPPRPKRMVKRVLHRWVNVYPTDSPDVMHPTKEDADRRADPSTRIACVEINQPYEVEE